MGLARNPAQIPDVKELKGQNPWNKGVLAALSWLALGRDVLPVLGNDETNWGVAQGWMSQEGCGIVDGESARDRDEGPEPVRGAGVSALCGARRAPL